MEPVITGIIIGVLLVGVIAAFVAAIVAIKKQVIKSKDLKEEDERLAVEAQLSEMLKDHYFESEGRRVRFHVKKYVLRDLYVGETYYDSFEEALAKESFTRKEYGAILAIQEVIAKEREVINDDMIRPKTHQKFEETPAGTIRIYNEGPVKLSPRFTILIGTNDKGDMEIGRAILAKQDLLTDDLRYDFKLVAEKDEVTEAEAVEYRAGFNKYFLSNIMAYRAEIAKYNEILDALERYNKHREDFTIRDGKMIWHGKTVVTPKQQNKPVNLTADPERDEVDRLIRSALVHE